MAAHTPTLPCAPSRFWMAMDPSGVSSISVPSTGDWKVTPCSVISAKCSSDTICNQVASRLWGQLQSRGWSALLAQQHSVPHPATSCAIGSPAEGCTRATCSSQHHRAPRAPRLTWKPPESVSIPRGHAANSCSPPISATS